MKQKEKMFLRVVKDADSAFYSRAAVMAAQAQSRKKPRRWLEMMKRTAKYIAAGAGELAAVLGICIFAGVFSKRPVRPGSSGDSSLPAQFVDPGQLEQQGNPLQLDVHFTDFAADDHAVSILNDALTVNEQYLYCSGYQDSFRINLQTGAAEYLCAVPGCLHDVNDAGCEMHHQNSQMLGISNGVIQVSGWNFRANSEDWLHGGRDGRLFWVNEFYTELDKTTNPSSPRATGMIRYFDGHYYIQTTNSLRRIDPKTGASSEPVISDSQIFSADGSDGDIWFTNEGRELMHWDPESGKTQKLADYASMCACNAQYVFYDRVTHDESGELLRSLMRCDRDGQNEACIIPDFHCFNGRFAVTAQSVYYYEDGEYADGQYQIGALLRCDLDGKNLHELPFDLTYSDGTHYRDTTQTGIKLLNCKNCDTIFLLDTGFTNEGSVEMDALFLIKKDTDEVQSVDLGKTQSGERRNW